MVSYEEFKEMMGNGIKDFLPEEYANARVEMGRRKTHNGTWHDCLIVQREGEHALAFFLEPAYMRVMDGENAQDVIRATADKARQDCIAPIMEQMERIRDYSIARPALYAMACNADMNAGLLQNAPHERCGDLALVYQIRLEVDEEKTMSLFVTDGLAGEWGIDMETLKRDAWDNMRQKMPPVFGSTLETICHLGNMETDQAKWKADKSDFMYTLTNNASRNGAAYLFDSQLMGKIAELLEDDLLAVPSSIDEILLVRESDFSDTEVLKEIVEEMNGQIDPSIVLSDEIYRFDRESLTLSVAIVPGPENEMLGSEPCMQMM